MTIPTFTIERLPELVHEEQGLHSDDAGDQSDGTSGRRVLSTHRQAPYLHGDWRRRALQGKKVPGQRVFAGIIPRTKREKRVAAVVAFSAGTTEELFYRGLMMSIAGALLGLSPCVAALVASICFGVAHIYQGWRGVLQAALLGGLLNLLLLWTGSLLVPVLLHLSLDFRGLVIVPLGAAARGPGRGQASLVHPAERR